MPRVLIKRPQGLISDSSEYEVPPEAWTDVRNVRFTGLSTQRVSGEDADVLGVPTGNPISLAYSESIGNDRWYYATTTELYETDGTTHTAVTRASGGTYSFTDDNSTTWSYLAGVLYCNNVSDHPQAFIPGATKFEDLANWPTSSPTYCKSFRTYGNACIALNITENGTNFPTRFKVSSVIEDPATVPTTWDPLSTTSPTLDSTLSDTDGAIVDGLTLRDAFLIYKEDSVHAIRFTNNIQDPYRVQKVFSDEGLLALNCVVEYEGKHFCVGVNDIYAHNGSSKASLVSDRIRTRFFEDINSEHRDRVFTVHNEPKSEIWVFYPDSVSTGPANKVAIYNYKTDAWSFRDAPGVSAAALGKAPDINYSYATLPHSSYDDISTTYSRWGNSFGRRTIIGASNSNSNFYRFDSRNTFNGTNIEAYVERTGLTIVDQPGDEERTKFVSRVYLNIKGSGTVDVSIGMENEIGEGINWSNPKTFKIGTDRKVDCRVTGRYFGIRIESTGSGYWDLSSYGIDYRVLGNR